MPPRDQELGRLEEKLDGLATRFTDFTASVNARFDQAQQQLDRRFEEHQRQQDDRSVAQGTRVGALETEAKATESQLWAKANEIDKRITDHELKCHKNGNGAAAWKAGAQKALPFVGTSGGSVIVWEVLKLLAQHLK